MILHAIPLLHPTPWLLLLYPTSLGHLLPQPLLYPTPSLYPTRLVLCPDPQLCSAGRMGEEQREGEDQPVVLVLYREGRWMPSRTAEVG